MLGKMIKHEFIATGRSFLPMYIFMIVLTPIFSLIMRLGDNADGSLVFLNLLSGLSIFGFVVMMVGIYMASTILIIVRFYRTTATSEAYLTFTLPVSAHQIILSKLLVAVIWQIVSGILMVSCVLVMTFLIGVWTPATFFEGLGNYLPMIFKEIPHSYLVLLPIMFLVGAFSGTLQYYCSISIGQLFRDHRVIGSIGVYLALSTIVQIISFVAIIPLAFLAPDSAGEYNSSYETLVFTLSILLNLVLGVGYYIATSFIMKKHLNVQ